MFVREKHTNLPQLSFNIVHKKFYRVYPGAQYKLHRNAISTGIDTGHVTNSL
jgi:hypothetical protein